MTEDFVPNTVLILPPGEKGEFRITRKKWIENEYSPEWVGESVRERALQLKTAMSMEILTDAFGNYVVKWYPQKESEYDSSNHSSP